MINRSKIIIDRGIALYIGKSVQTEFHKHHAMQIAIALKGIYQLHIGDEVFESRSVFINSNVAHKHTSNDGVQISVFVDAETDIGKLLSVNFPEKYHRFDVSPHSIEFFTNKLTNKNLSVIDIENFITHLFDLAPLTRKIDARIDRLIKEILSFNVENFQMKKLLQDIPLSESRIRHLFKEQTGISIQRYLLWTKIKYAFLQITKGENLSQSAYLAGFSDYSHMSRTIKEMFGLNLKTLLKDSHYIQD